MPHRVCSGCSADWACWAGPYQVLSGLQSCTVRWSTLCRSSAHATQHTNAPWLLGVAGQDTTSNQRAWQGSSVACDHWVGPSLGRALSGSPWLIKAAQLHGIYRAGLQLVPWGPTNLPVLPSCPLQLPRPSSNQRQLVPSTCCHILVLWMEVKVEKC